MTHENKKFMFLVLMLLWTSTISCQGEQEPHDIGQPSNSSSSTQIPRITVTEFDKWLGFPLDSIQQLQSINATNTSYEGIEYIKSPFKCSDNWTLYGRVKAEGWPRQYANSDIDFFLLDGRIQIISIEFNEEFPEILPKDSIWIDTKYRLGLVDKRTYHGIKQASGKRENALYPLEQMVDSQCKAITHDKRDIGYQCSNFALSASLRSNIHHGSVEHFTFQNSNGSDVIESGPTNPEILFDTLNKPTPPMYIDDILFGTDGGSSRMIIYKNKDALHKFFESVALDFRDEECIAPI